jgi:protein translocase SecG subunit
MQTFIILSQLVLGLILSVLILISAKGKGLGRGAAASMTSSTRRGLEQFLHKATFIIAGLFLGISASILFL